MSKIESAGKSVKFWNQEQIKIKENSNENSHKKIIEKIS